MLNALNMCPQGEATRCHRRHPRPTPLGCRAAVRCVSGTARWTETIRPTGSGVFRRTSWRDASPCLSAAPPSTRPSGGRRSPRWPSAATGATAGSSCSRASASLSASATSGDFHISPIKMAAVSYKKFSINNFTLKTFFK